VPIGSKDMRWSLFALVGAVFSLPVVAAPGAASSAAGEQQYLASMATKIATQLRFVDAAGRSNHVTGKFTGEAKTTKGSVLGTKETIVALPERVVEREVPGVRASLLEAIDAHGRRNVCATRISEVTAPDYDETETNDERDIRSFSFKVTQTSGQRRYEPLTKFMSPAQVIDWSDVYIDRASETTVTVGGKGQTFSVVFLTYVAADADAADRIEYAMRFLATSCR
jgi:hypothetical protein